MPSHEVLTWMLPVTLLAGALAGCLAGPGPATEPVPAMRLGDRYNYAVNATFATSSDKGSIWTDFANGGASFEVRIDDRTNITDQYGANRSCVEFDIEKRIGNESFRSDACLGTEHGQLLRLRTPPKPLFGVDHVDRDAPAILNAGANIRVDLHRRPPARSLFEQPEGAYTGDLRSPMAVAEGYTVEWNRSGDQVHLHGEMRYPSYLENVSYEWTATYDRSAPVPTEVLIEGRNATPWAGNQRGLEEPYGRFTIEWNLQGYDAGDGARVAPDKPLASSEAPHPRATDSETGEAPWTDELDPNPVSTRYPLAEAWRYARDNDPGLRRFLERGLPPFPSAVIYREFKEDDGASYAHEWNVTLCRSNGSCYASVGGLRIYEGGAEKRYVRTERGHDEYRSGRFDGFPLSRERAKELNNTDLRLDAILSSWKALQGDVQARAFLIRVVPIPDGPLARQDAQRRTLSLTVIHGRYTRIPHPSLPVWQVRRRKVISQFDPVSGRAFVVSEAIDPPPAWTEPYTANPDLVP